jgi:hypothetical protein
MFWRSDLTEATFQPDVFPPDDHKQMVNIFISSYVMNTLGLVLHKHRLLMHKFSKSDVSQSNMFLVHTELATLFLVLQKLVNVIICLL